MTFIRKLFGEPRPSAPALALASPSAVALLLSLVLSLLLALASPSAKAGPFSNQRNLLPGPRAAALGGAFVAIADDPSAVYWNPAGYSLMEQAEVSISGIGFIQSSTSFDQTLSDEPFVERAESLSPGFFGASLRSGRLGLGYGFAALDERNVNQNDFSPTSAATATERRSPPPIRRTAAGSATQAERGRRAEKTLRHCRRPAPRERRTSARRLRRRRTHGGAWTSRSEPRQHQPTRARIPYANARRR